ncbi:MAG: hypothetical protein ABTD50_06370 [Polyangiaceae bacterium]
MALSLSLVFAVGCGRRERVASHQAPPTTESAVRLPALRGSSTPSGSASPPASAAVHSSAPLRVAGGCRLARGPIGLPRRVPSSLVARGDVVLAVLDDDGHPRALRFVAGALAEPFRTPPSETVTDSCCAGPAVPCAVVANRAFCPDRSGLVHRASLSIDEGGASRIPSNSPDDRVVASARSGSRVSAAELGEGHVALGYVASRKTTEGWVSEAWLAVDDGPPQRISEDGSGATSVSLSARGSGLLAVMVDARSALTAVHARTVAYEAGRVSLGEDAVIFVGSPSDRRTVASVAALPGGPVWSLLPIAKDVENFGLALMRLHEPPRIEEPVVWSLYPNGLDAPPIAVAVARGRLWVARVRPDAAAPSAPEVLELGEVSDEGEFLARDTRAVAGHVNHVALTSDGAGALWIHWVDSSGSSLLRLACG